MSVQISGLTWLLIALLSAPGWADGRNSGDAVRINQAAEGSPARAAGALGNGDNEYGDFDARDGSMLYRGGPGKRQRLAAHHAVHTKTPGRLKRDPVRARGIHPRKACSGIRGEKAALIARRYAAPVAIEPSEKP